MNASTVVRPAASCAMIAPISGDSERPADLTKCVQHGRRRRRPCRPGPHGWRRRRSGSSSSPSPRRRRAGPEGGSRTSSLRRAARSREARRRRAAIPIVISERDPIRSVVLPGERRDQDDQDRHREEGGARLHGREAQDVLHVERDEEEDAEHRQGDEEDHECSRRCTCDSGRGRAEASARAGGARAGRTRRARPRRP